MNKRHPETYQGNQGVSIHISAILYGFRVDPPANSTRTAGHGPTEAAPSKLLNTLLPFSGKPLKKVQMQGGSRRAE